MLVSMTAYGYGDADNAHARIQVEIKSVNHRFCDVALRLPREYMSLEPRVAALVREVYGRGRVEVFVRRTELVPSAQRMQINLKLAQHYCEQLRALQTRLGLGGELNLQTLIGLEGVVTFEDAISEPEQDWPLVEQATRRALQAADTMRRQEGAHLRQDLVGRLATLRDLHARMVVASRTTTEDARERLLQKALDALQRVSSGELDHGRLMQEVVYAVDRSDISEELTRFGSHLEQLEALLDASEASGKRIEFLLQELLREVNTTGAKSGVQDVSSAAMLVKVELEKIREQIQNIE